MNETNFQNNKIKVVSRIQKWIEKGNLHEELDLSSLELELVPKEIFKLKELRRLKLDHNPLKTLPREFSKLTNLVHLSLNSSQFSELPQVIFELERLDVLFLQDNNLKKLSRRTELFYRCSNLNSRKFSILIEYV